MYIFIDEAGTFQIPSRPHFVSCIATLVVPEPFAATLFKRYRKASRPWRGAAKEVKGSQLDEEQVAAVLKILRRFDVLVVAACVDMGLHTTAGIEAHKTGQAGAFLRAIRPQTQPGMKRDLEDLSSKFRALSNQLYVQAVTLTEVVSDVLHASTLYYAQRIPMTLGSFKWRVDAKDISPTNYEKLWREVVASFLQSKSLTKPLVQLKGADYSAFAKFDLDVAEAPAHLRDQLPKSPEPFEAFDVKSVLTADLKFSPSERYCGLQLADVVANAIRRACNGNLQRRGWATLGKLMVQREKGRNALRFLSLQDARPSGGKLPYNDVVKQFDEDCKRMITRGSEPSAS